MTQTHQFGKQLSTRIFIGMLLGAVVGLVIRGAASSGGWIDVYLVDGLFLVVKNVFIASLKMLVVPLVFVSLVCGTSSLADPKKLGRVGVKTLALYLFTTAVAISLALLFALLLGPGVGAHFATTEFTSKAAPSVAQVLANLVPSNPIAAMASGNMLQIIVFAVLSGLAMSFSGEPGERVAGFFNDLNAVIMRLVLMLMNVAPFGVFAVMLRLASNLGADAFASLLKYFLLVLGVLLVHGLVTYPLLLQTLGRVNPVAFLRKMRAAQLFAFGTASSNATLPVTMNVVENRLGVANATAAFTLPLGATVNMDGTAIMQGVATVFIAQVYGIDLSAAQLLTVIMMSVLASVGTAGVPGVGLITLAMVLQQVGLPVEGIGLIIGVDRILDMTRTAVNITGDAAVTVIVAQSEGDLDPVVYGNPGAAG